MDFHNGQQQVNSIFQWGIKSVNTSADSGYNITFPLLVDILFTLEISIERNRTSPLGGGAMDSIYTITKASFYTGLTQKANASANIINIRFIIINI